MIDNFHQLNVKYDCTQFNTTDLVRIHFERNFELSHVDCNMTKGLIGNTIMMKLKSILEKKCNLYDVVVHQSTKLWHGHLIKVIALLNLVGVKTIHYTLVPTCDNGREETMPAPIKSVR
jgi:hypothetical protein